MTRLGLSVVVAVFVTLASAAERSDAQHVVYFTPAAPVVQTAFFAPAPVVQTPVVQTFAAAPAPVVQTAYFAPAPSACCTPAPAAFPVATPTVTYFRAPQVVMQPVPTVVTRHRPILGGTVTRVHNTWMPVVY
jgi:hypothetical protein